MARKTTSVLELIKQVNVRLRTPDSSLRLEGMTPEQAFRMGQYSLLESVLHATGNYKGFNFEPDQKTPEGALREDADETRRFYYC